MLGQKKIFHFSPKSEIERLFYQLIKKISIRKNLSLSEHNSVIFGENLRIRLLFKISVPMLINSREFP